MSENLSSFFEMGGYGPYIWPVYGLAAVLMIGLFVQSVSRWRQNEAEYNMLKSLQEQKNKTPMKESD